MKAKVTYTIEQAIVDCIVTLSNRERRSASGMAEMLIIEAIEARGMDAHALIEGYGEADPNQLSLLEEAEQHIDEMKKEGRL